MMTSSRPRAATSSLRLGAVGLALPVVLGGCGLGAGQAPAGVSLAVTEGRGAHVLRDLPRPRTAGEDTVLRLLARNAPVKTQYGGAFVSSIAGVDGGASGWFYWVDGIAAERGAAGRLVRDGDRIWWDRAGAGHASGATLAVVGQFPAPLTGSEGRHARVDLRCDASAGAACRIARRQLAAAGVDVAIGAGIPVVVAPLDALAAYGREAASLARGAKASGVFVRRRSAGHWTTLSDDGRPQAELAPGTGLVAAVRRPPAAPVWLVTGTDTAGLRRAARALDARALHLRAAAVVDRRGVRSLPESSGR